MVSEVIRVLLLFLADYPELHPHLCERRLVIRLIDSYDEPRSSFRHEHVLKWDILNDLARDEVE